ncbi:uncharacterized protein LOC119377587, partial [Rhipicephalus sanguineus]
MPSGPCGAWPVPSAGLTLSRYHGSTSRHLVEQLVDSLLASQPSSAGHLISTILDVSRDHKPLFITKNLARTCLTAFSWSCKVAHQVLVNRGDLKPDKIRDLVEAQTNLLLSVSSACDATLNKKLKRKINYLWKQVTSTFCPGYQRHIAHSELSRSL